MQAWCDELERAVARLALSAWREPLVSLTRDRLLHHRHGDLPRWQAAVARLPVGPAGLWLDQAAVTVGDGVRGPQEQAELRAGLAGLMPWRKGPFRFFDEFVDTEWRSDWKWERIAPHLAPLAGRRVLDVGCGNGYHLWRMLGAGAEAALGLDPSSLFLMQFLAVRRFATGAPAWLAPVRLEELPQGVGGFDTVLSLGVLYHRRSPLAHIEQLRSALRPGGELVLETLVIEDDESRVLEPAGRYAAMRNVWSIPSVARLELWLAQAGLEAVRCVDCTATTTAEQRSTDWMQSQSLPDFLDPGQPGRTREGHPAPVRATMLARRPG